MRGEKKELLQSDLLVISAMTLKEGSSPDSKNASVMPGVGPSNSTGQNTFESFYHGVCSELQSKGEVHSVSKIFSHFETDQDRMRFVLEKGQLVSLEWQ